MHDAVASFYGGYDQVLRTPRVRRHINLVVLLLAVAVVILIGFIAADVLAFQSIPAKIQVTSVEWYAGTQLLTTTQGFAMHATQAVTLTLSCNFICYEFGGATANAPFQVTGFAVSYSPIEFVNVTVVAPSSAYSGPLMIVLTPPVTGTVRA